MFKKEEFKKGSTEMTGFIGRGMSVEGKLSFEGAVRIDGRFRGELASNGTLLVGEGANVEAQIKVDTAVITGEVRGTVEATSRVELKAPGKMFGDIKTPNLIIGEGVIFDGNCIMTKKEGAVELKTARKEG